MFYRGQNFTTFKFEGHENQTVPAPRDWSRLLPAYRWHRNHWETGWRRMQPLPPACRKRDGNIQTADWYSYWPTVPSAPETGWPHITRWPLFVLASQIYRLTGNFCNFLSRNHSSITSDFEVVKMSKDVLFRHCMENLTKGTPKGKHMSTLRMLSVQ